MLKATVNDRLHLALCYDEIRGPRFGLCRSVWDLSFTHVLRKTGSWSAEDASATKAADRGRFDGSLLKTDVMVSWPKQSVNRGRVQPPTNRARVSALLDEPSIIQLSSRFEDSIRKSW
ncbi:hypothetical protein TNCV_455351 [Trichonephila clavipes]|nr:hypothetical protein TNCV_455351 [Trichonephila clavipes]